MKYLSLLTVLGLTIMFSGCGNNSDGEMIYKPKSGDAIPSSNTIVDSSGIIPVNTSAPAEVPTISSPIVNTQQAIQPSAAVPAGINPEHGKPGHRCDIAVGAPLNSPAPQPATPAITNTPAISQQPAKIVTTSQPAANTTAAGMNPEHGKPGHRCDIAVGAPLNSKPVTVETIPPTNSKTDAPVTPLLPSSSKPVAEGMNPEHGKPGHRCDIAVGDPLPKQ